jgi:aspartate aminotransferase
MTNEELRELRRKVAETTIEIIDLVASRNELAKKIGEVKVRESLPVEDGSVEDSLVTEVMRECDAKGVDRQVGLKVLGTLLAESKRVQGLQGKQQSLVTPMMIFAKALQIEASGRELLRLDVGEPNFHPPKAVLDATSEALYGFKTHYTGTRGIPEVLTAVKAYLERKYHYAAKESQLMVNPGGRFGVYMALSTTVKEGESAVIIEPNWPAYKEALQYIGARAISVPTTLEESWEPSVERVKEAIRPNTKAILLSYPSNPTGKIIAPAKFREILGVANDHKLTVISDEIYTDYAYAPCPSILQGGADRFILTSSFSKTWAMTGFRVGYTLSSEEGIAKMAKVQSLMVSSVPEFIQYGAIKALQSDSEVAENVASMKRRIDAASRELDGIAALQYVRPDGAMYVFPQARKPEFDSSDFTMKLIEEKGVTISPGTGFGNYPRCFRISLGQSEETIVQGIRRIGELLG